MKTYFLLLVVLSVFTACDKEEVTPTNFKGEFVFYHTGCDDENFHGTYVLRHDGLWKPDGEVMIFCGTGLTEEDYEQIFLDGHAKVKSKTHLETAIKLAETFPAEYLERIPEPGCTDAAYTCRLNVSLKEGDSFQSGSYCSEGSVILSSSEIVEYFEKVNQLIEDID